MNIRTISASLWLAAAMSPMPAAALAPSLAPAGAAPTSNGLDVLTLTVGSPSQTWHGPVRQLAANVGYRPRTGEHCGKTPVDMCDQFLVHVDDSAGFYGGLQIAFDNYDAFNNSPPEKAAQVVDLDIYVYESDPLGGVNRLVAANDDLADAPGYFGHQLGPFWLTRTGYYLVRIVYTQSLDATAVAENKRYDVVATMIPEQHVGLTQVSALRAPIDPLCDARPPVGMDHLPIDSEFEPQVVVNPRNPQHLVAAWQQEPSPGGHAVALGVGTSFDGGKTWSQRSVPWITPCEHPAGADPRTADVIGDVALAFGADGVVHLIASSKVPDSVFSESSPDGGVSWSDPAVVRVGAVSSVLEEDKETIAVDSKDPSIVYAAWAAIARGTFQENTGATVLFSRSSDQGKTWLPAQPVIAPQYDPYACVGAPQLLALADGRLALFFTDNPPPGGIDPMNALQPAQAVRLAVLFSSDHGMTWGSASSGFKPIGIATVHRAVIHDPETRHLIRSGDMFCYFDTAVGPDGRLAVVWADEVIKDGLPTGNTRVLYSESRDGGTTWSSPVEASQASAAASRQPFTPSVEISADGTVAVTYYDFRRDLAGDHVLSTDYWAALGDPARPGGLASVVNWREIRLTPRSFDMRSAYKTDSSLDDAEDEQPVPGVGEYQGLQAVGDDFVAVFVQPHRMSEDHDSFDQGSVFIKRFSSH